MKNRFLIFQIVGILIFLILFLLKYSFTAFIGDTIYIISYFYIALLFLIIGNVIFLLGRLKQRNSNR